MKNPAKHNISVFLIFINLLIITSCRKDLESGWDSHYITPLVTGSLTINDLIPDSLTQINADESITLVYQNNLLEYNLAEEAVEIPDTSVEYFISLDSLTIEDKIAIENISLGDVAIALGFPTGTIIIASNGSEIPIDPITGFASGPQPLDATSFFQTATFNAGYLDVEIQNGFPITLTNVTFKLTNASDGALVLEDTFDTILPGAVALSTTDLTGKTVDGNLIAEITNFDSPGSVEPVLIDTSDAVTITMTAYDMQLFSAIAVFPEQNLINNQLNVVYDMGGPEFTEMKVKDGDVVIYVVNTIPDSIHIEYNLPFAFDEFGNTVNIITVVPPGTEEIPAIVDEKFSIAGFTIDLRGSEGNSVNTFYQEFTASIKYTGIETSISLADSLKVIYGLENIVPLELEGYLGQYDIEVSDTTDGLNVFKQFTGGEIDFGEINVDLQIENGIGASGNVVINSLSAQNSVTGETVSLEAPEVIGVPISINRALDNPFIPGYTTISLNTANSNVDELMELLPDKLIYDVDMHVNPNGNEYNYQDFIIADSRLNIDLNLNMPLEFFASNLTLSDTFEVNINSTEEINGIQTLDIALYGQNTFPLDAQITIIFLDALGNALDSLNFNGAKIQPGILSVDCRVHEPQNTEIHHFIEGDLKDAILNSSMAQVNVSFNTASVPDCSEIVKIYSDYTLEFQLTGDMNYTFSTNDF